MSTRADPNKFSSIMYLPIEKWDKNFGVDRKFVLDFMLKHHEYMVERCSLPDQMEVKYALRKASFGGNGVFPTPKWETVGVFDGVNELIVMLKLIT